MCDMKNILSTEILHWMNGDNGYGYQHSMYARGTYFLREI